MSATPPPRVLSDEGPATAAPSPAPLYPSTPDPSTPDPIALAAAGSGRSVVLFDGVCALCVGSVTFIIDRDPEGRFAFASLQGGAADALRSAYPVPADLDTICLIEDGTLYTRSTAALRVARRLRGPWSLLYGFIVVPRPIRDLVYGFVARNRYRWFGQHDVCRLPAPGVAQRLLDVD